MKRFLSGMNLTKRGKTPPSRNTGKDNKKAKRLHRFSEQAWARVCQGRPPKYPEARPLAERCGVSVTHAIHVLAGRRKSDYLMQELVKMRAELAAKKEGGGA